MVEEMRCERLAHPEEWRASVLKTSPLCKVVQHTHTHQQMLRNVLLPAASSSPTAAGQCCRGDYAHSAVEFLLDIMHCCNHHPPRCTAGCPGGVWYPNPGQGGNPPGDSSGSEYGSRDHARDWSLQNLKSSEGGQTFNFPFNFHYVSILRWVEDSCFH